MKLCRGFWCSYFFPSKERARAFDHRLLSLCQNVEQTEGEDKARALKVLQAHNAGLTRELGQVDMSLMQALEDNGLTLDNVRLQNTTMSRRLGRRRCNDNWVPWYCTIGFRSTR